MPYKTPEQRAAALLDRIFTAIAGVEAAEGSALRALLSMLDDERHSVNESELEVLDVIEAFASIARIAIRELEEPR